MSPKGKVIPCHECGKDVFVELDHGFWGKTKCPHCGAEVILMAPKSGQAKQMLRMMGTSEEEMNRLEALQEEFNAKRSRKQQYKKPWWKFWD